MMQMILSNLVDFEPDSWVIYVGHAEIPLFSQATNSVLYSSFDYAPAREKIAPPSLGARVDEQAHDFKSAKAPTVLFLRAPQIITASWNFPTTHWSN